MTDSTTNYAVVNDDRDLVLRRWITIGRPAAELCALWLQPDTLPRVMAHFAHVEVINDSDARWEVEGPMGKTWRWESRITEVEPGRLIAWRALDGADVPNEGQLELSAAPGEWGTEIALTLRFNPPGGKLGKKMTSMLDIFPKEVASKALHRFKSLAETGEIPTLYSQPAGRHAQHKDDKEV